MQKTIEMLAEAYCRMLHDALTPEQIVEINCRNDAEGLEYICHTHDFCDANQCMIDALDEIHETFDPQSAAQAAWIDEAWSLSKEAGFDIPTVRQLASDLGVDA